MVEMVRLELENSYLNSFALYVSIQKHAIDPSILAVQALWWTFTYCT